MLMWSLLIILLVITITLEAQRMNFDQSNFGQMVGLRYMDTEDEAVASTLPRNRIVTREQLPLVHRVIPPGSMVTMDYRMERMNVHLDEHDIVKKVKYG
jgi:peptidase inhibitor I78 family protein